MNNLKRFEALIKLTFCMAPLNATTCYKKGKRVFLWKTIPTLFPLWKRAWPFFEMKWILLTKRCYVYILVEINSMVRSECRIRKQLIFGHDPPPQGDIIWGQTCLMHFILDLLCYTWRRVYQKLKFHYLQSSEVCIWTWSCLS